MEIKMTSIAGLGGGAGAQHAPRAKPPTFDALDTNQDGTVSADELSAALTQSSSSTDSSSNASNKAAKLFKAMDTDGSGGISQSEKQAFDAKRADQMQANQFATQLLVGGLQLGSSTQTDTSASAPADLLAAAQSAYSSTTTNTDLFSILSSTLNGAA
jgi:hypothetical protein